MPAPGSTSKAEQAIISFPHGCLGSLTTTHTTYVCHLPGTEEGHDTTSVHTCVRHYCIVYKRNVQVPGFQTQEQLHKADSRPTPPMLGEGIICMNTNAKSVRLCICQWDEIVLPDGLLTSPASQDEARGGFLSPAILFMVEGYASFCEVFRFSLSICRRQPRYQQPLKAPHANNDAIISTV